MIRAARPEEIALLPQIENAADGRYARVGLPQVIAMLPASIASLERGRRDGRLWVAVSPMNRVVGFAFGARPLARRELGHDTLFLSTYLGVPWNAPFYEHRGFSPVPRGKWPQAFRRQFMIENSHGHPPWRRTIMQRRV